MVHIVCNTVGVWAVDDHGCIHFRYGHISNSNEFSLLNPAWIPIPGEPEYNRSFAHIFCGPEKWMVIFFKKIEDLVEITFDLILRDNQ